MQTTKTSEEPRSENQTPGPKPAAKRLGGDTRSAAAANGKRVGRPPKRDRLVIMEAQKVAFAPDGTTLTHASVILEGYLARHAEEVATLLLESARGVLVQKETKDGPRVYKEPPSVAAQTYISTRIAGLPISKTDLMTLLEKAGVPTGGPATTREDMLRELLIMVLQNSPAAPSQTPPPAPPLPRLLCPRLRPLHQMEPDLVETRD